MDVVTLDARSERQRHALLGHPPGWHAALLHGVEESPCDGDLRLLALPGCGRPLVDAAGTLGGLVEPTGVAVDRLGTIYVADTGAHAIKRFDPCCGAFEVLPCVGGEGGEPRRLRGPRGIAISRLDVLYVADTANRRVQVFALEGTALLAIIGPLGADGRRLPGPDAAGAWLPWDVALDSRCRVFVSDRDNGVVHVLNSRGRWLGARGSGPGSTPLVGPTHLAIDRDDRLYVVQEGRDDVVVFAPDGELVGRADPPQALAGRFLPGPLAADPHGNLFVADRVARRLCSYRCPTAPGTPVEFSGGVCTIEGPVAGLAFDGAGNALATDPDGGRIIGLEGAVAYATDGRFVGRAIDSGLVGCEWHRVVLTGSVPSGDRVRVDTYTSDGQHDEAEILELADDAWSTGLSWTDPERAEWECLVLSPPGRYLWLRLTLEGSGATTPLIASAKIYFPRSSSIRYLPAVYRPATPEDTFLERFLSIFDTLFASVEGRVDDFAADLDRDAAPAAPLGHPPGQPRPDFLTWLASWFGLTFEGTLDEARRRNLLRHVMRLYRGRGTPRGIREAVQVALGLDPDACASLPMPGVLEHYKLRRWLFVGNARLGGQSALWGKRIVDRLQVGEHSTIGTFRITGVADPLRDPFHHYAHRFTVFVPESIAPTDADRRMVERIVELAKPAHTEHTVEFVAARFRVGVQATIGLDAVIGRYPAGVVSGEARVGYDAVLQEPPTAPARPAVQIGRRSRLGTTVLGGGPS